MFITIIKHIEKWMVDNLTNADALYVPYENLDIRKSSIKIYGAGVWNSIPPYIQRSESIIIVNYRLQFYLIDRK